MVGVAGGRAAARAEAVRAQTGPGRRAGSCTEAAGTKAAMAGYVPGLLPANRSQEKEFVQAYEDVLERYKGTAAGGGARCGAWSQAGPPRGG